MARDSEVHVAFADEGRYVGRGEEDAERGVVFLGYYSKGFFFGMYRFLLAFVFVCVLFDMIVWGSVWGRTYSAIGWFCTMQTSSRFGRLNWMSAPG